MADILGQPTEGVSIPPDWVCAFVACGQRADQPHVDGCPYSGAA